MPDVTVTEVARNLTEYLDRVVSRRESFTLTRGNKRMAELRPLPVGARLSELPGLCASLPPLSPVEAEAFGEDLAAARAELAGVRTS